MDLHLLSPAATAPDFNSLCRKLKIDEDFEDEFRDIYDECVKIARPKLLYGRCPVRCLDDGVSVEVGNMRFSSHILHVNFSKSSFAWPYVATCGRELYEFSLSQGDPLSQYWVDTVSEAYLRIGLTVGMKQLQLDEETSALSAMNPGSLPDWPISQQRPLFDLLGNVMDQIGVELTESFLMLPVKSVSGLLFESEEHYENCSLCPRKGCPGRRAPFTPQLYKEKYNL